VLNNLAQLYHYQCAYDGCDWYMACLDHTVQANTQCLQDANDARLLSAYEVEEIQLNLVFVRPPPVAHAA
jgi:hypothetical protein